jgi:hypothetical protein
MRRAVQKSVILLLILCSYSLADLIYGVYYNPGLKFGYQFGKKGGFIITFENSVVGAVLYGTPFAGIVGGAGINLTQRKFIGYWEAEAGFGPVGVAFGGQWYQGYSSSIRVFGGAALFLSYKYLFSNKIHEIALVGKGPLEIYTVMDHGTYLFGKEIKHRD